MVRGRFVNAGRYAQAIGASLGGLTLSFVLSWGTQPSLHGGNTQSLDHYLRDMERAAGVAQGFAIVTSAALLLTAIVPLALAMWRERPETLSLPEKATGFSVAADGPGFSVAIGHGRSTSLVEVDTLEEARQIATAVKARFPAHGNLELALPRRSPLVAVSVLSLVALTFSALVPIFVFGKFWDGLSDLAVAAVLLWPALIVFLLLWLRPPIHLQWGVSGVYELPRALDRSPLERHVRRHIEARLAADPGQPRVRVDLLSRGIDSVSAWLARLDAMPRGAGYRESAPRELLFETLNDVNAAIDVRLSAARLLRVRDGEERTRISEEITDAEVRARVDAVTLDDLAEAEAALDAVGPMFRTRR